jgi:hypothetical protein
MVTASHTRDRNAHEAWGRLKTVAHDNGLSLVSGALFLVFVVGLLLTGAQVYNEQLQEHGRAAISLGSYVSSGHFLEALFENWESEFLQMALLVVLTVRLFQRGSAESHDPDQPDADEGRKRPRKDSPWPVRRGGVARALYERSLSFALFGLFFLTFVLHAATGVKRINAENALHGAEPMRLGEYVASSQFWYESFQNWQSEFLAVLAIVVLSIFLRQRGSVQSKPVAAPHSETGH